MPAAPEDFGTFSFDGKTIDFGALELRSGDSDDSSHGDGVGTAAASGAQRRTRLFRASRFWKRFGGCTKIPTRGPSIILWYGCGATSRMIRGIRGIC